MHDEGIGAESTPHGPGSAFSPAGDRKTWQALISEARNGLLMALGHNGGDEQILGAK